MTYSKESFINLASPPQKDFLKFGSINCILVVSAILSLLLAPNIPKQQQKLINPISKTPTLEVLVSIWGAHNYANVRPCPILIWPMS